MLRAIAVMLLAVTVAGCAGAPPPMTVAPPPVVASAPPAPVVAPPPPEDPDHPTTLAGKLALGRRVYETKGCISCHSVDGTPRLGPTWGGIWGQTVRLTNGDTRTVDAAYIEESVLHPSAAVVAGFPVSMPSYEGVLEPDEVASLLAYIESVAHVPPSS